MRIKLSILTGAVAFTVAGIAVASQDKALFSSHNPLSTISDLVSTSLWSPPASDSAPETDNSKNKSIHAIAPSGQILRNISLDQPTNNSTYVPGTNFQTPDNNPNNSNQTIEYGYSGNDNVISGSSGNSFMGGLGGGSNWVPISKAPKGATPNSGGGLYQFPGIMALSSNGTLTYTVAALTVSPAPEPGEWLLMLAGFGLVGFMARFRKQTAAFA